jgi:tryptophan-rich sensory protein
MKPLVKDLIGLAVIVAAVVAVSAGGAVMTAQSVDQWYPTLSKPPLNPPDWVFGPVWTLLYTAMAIAAFLVWRRRGQRLVAAAMVVFGVQLALNGAWSILFFGLRNPLAALVDILLLWLAIVATVLLFWRVRPKTALLMLPYLLWVSFAVYLNWGIWRLNS